MGGHDLVRRMDRQGEVLIWCNKVFGIREAKNRTKTNELLQTGTDGHQRIWQNDAKSPNFRGRKSPSQRGKAIVESREEKKRITRKEYKRL